MITTIKQKLTFSVIAVVLLALVLSLGFTYTYIRGQMRAQILSDNQIRLSQTAHMLEYISNDITNLTRSIIADEEVNALIAARAYQSTAQEVSAVYSAIERMRDYIGMREFVQSIALIYADGTVLWDKAPFDDYFAGLMRESWYTEGKGSQQRNRFSKKHNVATLWNEDPVISLIAATVDLKHMGTFSGEVIVNVRFNWILGNIRGDAETFDGFCWLRPDGELFWQQGEMDIPAARGLVSAFPGESLVHRMREGYLITQHTPSNGWTLVSYVSDPTIDTTLRHIPLLFLGMGLVSILCIALAVSPIIRRIVRPVNHLVKLMGKAGEGDLSVRAHIDTNDEMAVLGEGFNNMVSQLDENIALMMDNERQIRQQGYGLILARLNPHFIYNTLNTVVYLATRDGSKDSAEVAASLIVLLQDIIKISDESAYSGLGHELETVVHYCRIQQYRYPGKFSLRTEVPEALRDAIIPKTILQPLVENALLHGLFPTNRTGEVLVCARLEAGSVLVLEVQDSGDGMDVEKVEGILRDGAGQDAARHIGLSSIAERIRYLYGDAYGLSFENGCGIGTVVRVRLPYRK